MINADLMDLYRVNLGRVIGACMLLLVLAGCNSIKPQNEVSEPLPTQTVSDVSAVSDSTGTEPKRIPKFNEYPVAPFKNDALYQLLVAEVAGYRGEYEIALEKYMEMATETQDAGVAARATRLANYLKRNDLALQASQIWSEVDPDSIEAHRHAADQLVRSGDLEQAILHMEAIKNLGGLANFDVFAYRAANLEPQEREALLVGISRMLETDPDDEQLLFSKAVLPFMKEAKKGHIISVASDVAKRVFDGGALYCSSKYAQHAFTEALRKEVRKDSERRLFSFFLTA